MLSQTGRKGSVDGLIRKLSNKELIRGLNRKELSADELKQLGDLYLRKGDREKAVEYFYRAADELSVTHVNKAVAVYKKILNISPAETEACERIISILSGEGLAAEQIKYLMMMARVYAGRNDLRKADSVYRRILDLDPHNASAEEYFTRGKAVR